MILSAVPLQVERGGWCDTCELSSVMTVTTACEIDRRPWRVVTVSLCTECFEQKEPA